MQNNGAYLTDHRYFRLTQVIQKFDLAVVQTHEVHAWKKGKNILLSEFGHLVVLAQVYENWLDLSRDKDNRNETRGHYKPCSVQIYATKFDIPLSSSLRDKSIQRSVHAQDDGPSHEIHAN